MTNYRKIRTDEWNLLPPLVMALYEEDPEGEKMTPDKIENTVMTLDIHPDLGKIVVFYQEKQLIGYAIIINYYSNEYGGIVICLDELYIKPNWRCLGIATEFFQSLCRNAGDAVAIRVEATSGNDRVRKLYKRWGFCEEANRRLVMKL